MVAKLTGQRHREAAIIHRFRSLKIPGSLHAHSSLPRVMLDRWQECILACACAGASRPQAHYLWVRRIVEAGQGFPYIPLRNRTASSPPTEKSRRSRWCAGMTRQHHRRRSRSSSRPRKHPPVSVSSERRWPTGISMTPNGGPQITSDEKWV